MILKTLISMLKCLWLGLELKSAGKWISQARFEDPLHRRTIEFHKEPFFKCEEQFKNLKHLFTVKKHTDFIHKKVLHGTINANKEPLFLRIHYGSLMANVQIITNLNSTKKWITQFGMGQPSVNSTERFNTLVFRLKTCLVWALNMGRPACQSENAMSATLSVCINP